MNHFGKTVGVEVLTLEGMQVLSFNDLVDQHLNFRCSSPYRLASYEEIRNDHWLKVMFAMPEALMPEFSAFLRRLPSEGVRFVRSEREFFEILPEQATKGNALERLCRREGLSLAYTVAIGDCDNDLEMLLASRVGVAVANAYPELQAAADMITVSNTEHAVAGVIRELMADPDGYFARYGKDVQNG